MFISNRDDGISLVQTYTFDFFNYAGIHRSVMLYTTPRIHISDIITTTDIIDSRGKIFYQLICNKNAYTGELSALVQIRDKEGEIVANATASSSGDIKGYIEIDDVKPWWPYLMHPEPGYLYTLEVNCVIWHIHCLSTVHIQCDCIFKVILSSPTEENVDIYRLKIGVRTLHWNSQQFLINGKPIYFRGFGRHEDSDVRHFYCD